MPSVCAVAPRLRRICEMYSKVLGTDEALHVSWHRESPLQNTHGWGRGFHVFWEEWVQFSFLCGVSVAFYFCALHFVLHLLLCKKCFVNKA